MGRFFLILTLSGCGISREDFGDTFSRDPLVRVEHGNDSLTYYDSRSMILDMRSCGGKYCFLLMGCTLVRDEQSVRGATLRFRSLGENPRFLENRDLSLSFSDSVFTLGDCEYLGLDSYRSWVKEDMKIDVPAKLLLLLDAAQRVTGSLGPVRLEVSGQDLAPIRALLDTSLSRAELRSK